MIPILLIAASLIVQTTDTISNNSELPVVTTNIETVDTVAIDTLRVLVDTMKIKELDMEIFDLLERPHPYTKAKVNVYQSDEIEYITLNTFNRVLREVKGYRVQIFSSNSGPVARDEAFEIEKLILESGSNLEVYVIYESPFWKVRIGNCLTRLEAQALLIKVRELFPDYSNESYVVPTNILVK